MKVPVSDSSLTEAIEAGAKASEDLAITLAELGRALHAFDHVPFGNPPVSGRWVSGDPDWICGVCGRWLSEAYRDEGDPYLKALEAGYPGGPALIQRG